MQGPLPKNLEAQFAKVIANIGPPRTARLAGRPLLSGSVT